MGREQSYIGVIGDAEHMLYIDKGRPKTKERRLYKEVKVYDKLDELGIEYYRGDHEEAATMEACRAIEETLGARICKNLFLCNRQKTAFYLLLMPADKVFKTKDLSKQIGSARLSFAEAEDMEHYLDILPGAVSVMGLMNDTEHAVKLLIDEEVLSQEYIGCHPCVNTTSLRIKTDDVLKVFVPATGHDYIVVR